MRTKTRESYISPWVALPLRTALFIGFQSIFALVFLLVGNQDPWTSGAAWWSFSVIGTNGITMLVLIRYLVVLHVLMDISASVMYFVI